MTEGRRGVPFYLRVRRPVQVLTALVVNARYLFDARPYCFPVLNCWACPVASFACPMGALQNMIALMRSALLAPLYVLGTIVAISALLGRAMCGWLCPFGLLQDLLGRIHRHHWRPPPWTGYLKYAVLIGLGLIAPYLTFVPWFCKFCPQGALEGGIFQPLLYPELRELIHGWWFLKIGILVAFIVASIFIRRPFCRSFCALGAIFSLFNRFSLIRINYDREACTDCMWCVRACPAGIDPRRDLEGMACVSCMECAKCPFDAIHVTCALTAHPVPDRAGEAPEGGTERP
jgi:ferredoxin-type protein NapH